MVKSLKLMENKTKSAKFISIVFSCLLIGTASSCLAEEGFTDTQKKQIGDVVKEYIIQNPEVIKEAFMALQKKEVQAMEQNIKNIALTEKDNLFSSKNPNSGAKSPKEVMVMFFDYQCHHCQNVAKLIDPLLSANPDLKIIYKELPIFGESSMLAAKAALAANKQGKYPEFHQKLMSSTDGLDEEKIMTLAKEMGLDDKKLKNDMALPEITAEIQSNLALAQKLGLRGTPAFFIAPSSVTSAEVISFVPGEAPKEKFQSLIEKARSL